MHHTTKRMGTSKKRSAFTMNELMIAATIVGIIASITLPVIFSDTNKLRSHKKTEKTNMALMNALKMMRIEDKLTGLDTTENFVEELKNHLNISKTCSNSELSKCFAKTFKIVGEDKNISEFDTASSLDRNWGTNINGIVLQDGTSMLLAYNPNCSKFALANCMTAIYDTTGGGKGGGSSHSVKNVNLGEFNNTIANNTTGDSNNTSNSGVDNGTGNEDPGDSSCGTNPTMTSIGPMAFKLHMDGPSGATQTCISENQNVLIAYCESTIHEGYNGIPDVAHELYSNWYGVPLGTFLCIYPCIALGTPITLADGSYKTIENISYDDDLLVWDFDNGKMSSAKPAWIKQAEVADRYNLLTFSDGTQLKTINQHRIFNKELGKFTYPMTDETPLGTTTLLADGREVQLVDKKVVYEPVEFYNLITANHFNCFASNVLTSNRFNNLYPISDYKFVKDDRELTPYSEYENFVSRDWYEKLRLAEQTCDEEMKLYLSNLVRLNKKQLALV